MESPSTAPVAAIVQSCWRGALAWELLLVVGAGG